MSGRFDSWPPPAGEATILDELLRGRRPARLRRRAAPRVFRRPAPRAAAPPRPPTPPAGRASDRAVAQNRSWGSRLRWLDHFPRIVRLLGFTGLTPGELAFAEAVARWQAARGLASDGILGPRTWEAMRTMLGLGPSPAPSPAPAPAPAPGCEPTADFTPDERTAVALTSRLETGRPFGCPVSAVDGISMGMLQWNLQAGTLQHLLAEFERRTGRLRSFFGAEHDRLMRLVALTGSKSQNTEAARQAGAEGLARRWRDPLSRLCADATFCSMLMADVRRRLRTAANAARRLGLRTLRGFVLVFDIEVGDGLGATKLGQLEDRLRQARQERGRALSEREALVELAEEAARKVKPSLQEERRLRRRLIAQGSGPYRRSQWDLDREFPNLDRPWQP